MHQTLENGKKPNFGHAFGLFDHSSYTPWFDPTLCSQFFFCGLYLY